MFSNKNQNKNVKMGQIHPNLCVEKITAKLPKIDFKI